MQELTEETFTNTLIKNEGTSVVQFTAPWCIPCQQLTPRLTELSEEENVDYYKVDVENSPGLTREFNIRSVPTVMIYRAGRLKDQWTGLIPKNEIRKRLTAAVN